MLQAAFEKQSAEQQEKKERAAQQVQRLQLLLKRASNKSAPEAASVQADIQLALITETNDEVLQVRRFMPIAWLDLPRQI